MKVLVDAWNLSAGGGLKLLNALISSPSAPDITLIAAQEVVPKLAAAVHEVVAVRGRTKAAKAKIWIKTRSVLDSAHPLVLTLGGLIPPWSKAKHVLVVQNMVPFDPIAQAKYSPGKARLRYTLLRLAASRSIKRADHLIFLSNHSKTLLSVIAASKPHHVIHLAPGSLPENPAERDYEKANKLVLVSAVAPYKNYPETLEGLSDAGFSGIVLVAGDIQPPAKRSWKKAIRLWSGKFRVEELGWLRPDRLRRVLKEADIMFWPSSCEAYPTALAEGAAYGLPIAASSLGPAKEILGPNAVYFDPLAPHSIASAAKTILSSSKLRERLGRGARDRVISRSWPRVAAEMWYAVGEVARKWGLSF